MIRQFEVAGHEIGTFIIDSVPIADYTWAIYFEKREESEDAAAAISRVIAEAKDPKRIPVKSNWEDKVGSLTLDDSPMRVFKLVFADTEARERPFQGLRRRNGVPVG